MAKHRKSRDLGLDFWLALVKWQTGEENLHYGDWTGLEPIASNLGAAQGAYNARLFAHLPDGEGLRILDIGGGAGVQAGKLGALGHTVDVVVPGARLAERARENAPAARVFETTFEAFDGTGPYDICLFSESFQYIPLDIALDKAARLLRPGGTILIADCFRSAAFDAPAEGPRPGGGHRLAAFREALAARPLRCVAEEDWTDAVAPSLDFEQGLFDVIGRGVQVVNEGLSESRPGLYGFGRGLFSMLVPEKRRKKLAARLFDRTRTPEAFRTYNRYLLLKLETPG